MRSRAGVVVLAFLAGACRGHEPRQAPAPLAVTARFAAGVGREVIAGRVDEGPEVVLLSGGVDLVRIDLDAQHAQRTHLAIESGQECWSLARLNDGSLWTLKSRRTLARLGDDGRVVEEAALGAAHFGLFDAGDRLVYQLADFTPPGAALHVGSPDGEVRVAWSALQTRRFDSLARASAAALNMVSCGATRTAERPCWFPDEAAVSLVDDAGLTRRVLLPGLEVVAPEILLTSDNPRRPVRDAFVDATGDLWILSSGTPPPGASQDVGGWILARYGSQGQTKGFMRLAEAARLILRADSTRITLLLATGSVGEAPIMVKHFVVLRPWPVYAVVVLGAVVALGLVTIWLDPGELDSGLGMVLFVQMFLASSGFAATARRGHFDQVLVQTVPLVYGKNRRMALASEWLAAIAPGACAWAMLSAAGYALQSPAALSALAGFRLASFFIVSALAWGAGFLLPRGAAGALWIGVLAVLLVRHPDLVGPGAPQMSAVQVAKTAAAILLCPFLLLGTRGTIGAAAVGAALAAAVALLLITWRAGAKLDVFLLERS